MPPPTSARSVIETDTFCDACGFNLMTQPVWRDEALGILVCRCPECGRHHGAQGRSSVGTVWLNRVGTFGLMLWVVSAFLAAAVLLIGLSAMSGAGIAMLTWQSSETSTGIQVTQAWNGKGGFIYVPTDELSKGVPSGSTMTYPHEFAASDIREVHRVVGWLPGGRERPNNNGPDAIQAILTLSIFSMCVMILAAYLAAAAWHWRPGRQYAWLVTPIVAAFFVYYLAVHFNRNRYSPGVLDNRAQSHVLFGLTVLQLLLIAIALRFGRPIVRILLTMFLHPRARQVFAFLWLCDGKTPPPASLPGDPRPPAADRLAGLPPPR